MRVVVAIDGGGSKTDVAILGLDGVVLSRARHGAFTGHMVGEAGTVKQLDAVVSESLAALGSPEVVSTSVCFADIDFPFEVAAYTAQLRECAWAGGKLFVDNDTFALLRAGTTEAPAVAVVCGTGMNCVGQTADGRVARFAALGEVSGDWGGGGGLGMMAIWHAARAADGRGPSTLLQSLVLARLGRASMDDVIIGFHTGELSEVRIPSLAPLIFEAGSQGDEVAIGVIDRQADEIVAYATAAMRRLGILGQPCQVVLGGGVIAGRHHMLLDGVEQRLAEQAPGARCVIVKDPPIVGAALLAFDALDADATVLDAVRNSLTGV